MLEYDGEMVKIEGFIGKAEKKGDGYIEYDLWINNKGELFVRFLENNVDTEKPGTHSNVLYPVKVYAPMRYSTESIGYPTGVDFSGEEKTPSDNNNGAFLKAVLCDLLPKKLNKR